MSPRILALVAGFVLVSGCADSPYLLEHDVVYTPPGWPAALAADIYLPGNAGPRPAVLLVHGGGWESRERGDMDGIAARLAARGFVVMNASYRFAPAHRHPAQLHDLQQALRWLRSRAAHYAIDPLRVGAFGYSSGGHLVALLGTVSTGDPLDQPYGGKETRLQAVVAGGAPLDLRKFTGGRMVPQFLGATGTENPALFAAASPVVHVTPDDPPMFLYHGGGDTLVDVAHAEDMKHALDRAGVRAELRIVPILGHIPTFLLARGTENEAMNFLESVLMPALNKK
jgi:acetyl esterase/lipase